MATPVTSTTPARAAMPIPGVIDRSSVIQAARVAAAAAIALMAAHFWTDPASRGLVVLSGAMLLWALDVLPDYVVALGVIVAWNVASYLTFQSASEGYLFRHDQVRAFSGAYVLLSLGGLLASIPVWSLLGLL